MKTTVKKIMAEYSVTALLAVIMAFNYILFIVPNSFAPAGLTGIATMIQYKLGFSIGWLTLIVNIPLCIIAFFYVNRELACKTLVFCVIYSSVYILLQHLNLKRFEYDAGGVDTIFPCLIAGIINGIILGVCFRINASGGGTDIVAKLVGRKKPQLNFFWVTLSINIAVAAASFFVYAEKGENGEFIYDYRPVAQCMLYCFITSFIGNLMLKGSKTAYKFVVITPHAQEIEKEIMQKLRRSATRLKGEGAYSNTEREVLLCVVGKHQVLDFQN
ncbi:MAG: YitT family protein, partial [Clostridia bacterium]|nr:YitT family protein [Clostridia bacterium]